MPDALLMRDVTPIFCWYFEEWHARRYFVDHILLCFEYDHTLFYPVQCHAQYFGQLSRYFKEGLCDFGPH